MKLAVVSVRVQILALKESCAAEQHEKNIHTASS